MRLRPVSGFSAAANAYAHTYPDQDSETDPDADSNLHPDADSNPDPYADSHSDADFTPNRRWLIDNRLYRQWIGRDPHRRAELLVRR